MNNFQLREEILKEHSKRQCDAIIAWVGTDQHRFDALFHLFGEDEYRVSQRASWPLGYIAASHPALIQKRLKELVSILAKPGIHDAVKRNTLRILQAIELPKKHHGPVMNYCFQFIESPSEPVAIKAFSITILGKLAKIYPDILPEIQLLINQQLPHQTAAFKSRAKQLLGSLDKL